MLCKGPYWKVKLENFIKKKLANPSIKAKKVCVGGGEGTIRTTVNFRKGNLGILA